MIEIKRAAAAEVHMKLLNPQKAYDTITKILEEKHETNILARFKAGAGYYVWEHEQAGWKPLSQANADEQQLVFEKTHQNETFLKQSLGTGKEKIVETLLKVPDESSYIFFRHDEAGKIQVLLTGWGFVRIHNVVIRKEEELKTPKKQEVYVRLCRCGEPLPGRGFYVHTPSGQNRCTTDADGRYFIDRLAPGTAFSLTDEQTQRAFQLVVEDGKSEYDFDITEYCDIAISVTHDGVPLPNIPCTLSYHGTHGLTTDAQGSARLRLPIRDGECTVQVGEWVQSQSIQSASTSFTFAYETKRFTPRIRIEGNEGLVGANYPIDVELNGLSTHYVSDEKGMVFLPESPENQQMVVRDSYNADNVQTYTLKAEQEEYVFHIPYGPAKDPGIHLFVRHPDGKPYANAQIKLQQDGHDEFAGTLDANGELFYDRQAFALQTPITATLTGRDEYAPVVYQMEEGEDEYLLQEDLVQQKSNLVGEILAIAAVAIFVVLSAYPLCGLMAVFSHYL